MKEGRSECGGRLHFIGTSGSSAYESAEMSAGGTVPRPTGRNENEDISKKTCLVAKVGQGA